MTGPTSRLCLLLVCVASALESAQSGPLPNDGVLVEQVMRTSSSGVSATAASTQVTVGDEGGGGGGGGFDGGVDNESVLDTSAGASDDLIFLTARKPTTTLQQEKEQQHHDHQQQSPAQNPHHHHRGVHQIDSLATETTSTSCEEDDDDDDDVVWEEYDPESRNENLSTSSGSTIAPPPALDMRPFVALIPADEVKTIAGKYYRRDPEVQRAYAYLSGRDFVELRQRIVDVPEMAAFLRFLRASGLDVLGFLQSLTNLTKGAAEAESVTEATVLMAMTSSSGQTNAIGVNSIQGSSLGERDSAIEKVASSSPAPATTTTTEGEAEQSLNGLHGLVDSVLDILPQDQILSTFFDKLDSDERFARLVDNVSSPDFARILRNMENSVPLRNLIFTLHNNGIYITRIVDSLKAYFFLGGF